jgi:predicted AAA+ superfamily ATPase
MLVKRETHLSRLRPFIGAPFIKILTGIRRCGKSTILELLKGELIASGIEADKILHINLEMYDYEDLESTKLFSGEIQKFIKNKKKVYLLLDEVQLLSGWERVVNSLFAAKKADIYITGSNSNLLSSELASLLSGRYVQFAISPLSFGEYLDFARELRGLAIPDPGAHIWDYIRFGGFPGIHFAKDMESRVIYQAVAGIFSTVVLKDVIQRNQIRHTDMLERFIRFLFDNTGKLFSGRSLSDYFKSQGRKVSVDTILEYIEALKKAYIIEAARRYDIKGKKLLNVREKYYIADVSFIHAILGYDDGRIAGVMENIVYWELRRRGYDVYVGQYDDKEIDFVCLRQNEKLYVQVTYTINNDPKIINREFGNLLKINDQYPKYVVSLDKLRTSAVEGVRHVYLPDFLLMKDSF